MVVVFTGEVVRSFVGETDCAKLLAQEHLHFVPIS